MIDHLPECPLGQPCQSSEPDHVMQGTIAGIPVTVCGLCMADCICDRLRACEQRVYDERNEAWVKKCRASERHALDAAREAVENMPAEPTWEAQEERIAALAAIDALREKP